jgi:hypothetical protein
MKPGMIAVQIGSFKARLEHAGAKVEQVARKDPEAEQ